MSELPAVFSAVFNSWLQVHVRLTKLFIIFSLTLTFFFFCYTLIKQSPVYLPIYIFLYDIYYIFSGRSLLYAYNIPSVTYKHARTDTYT